MHALPAARTGQPGRRRVKGDRHGPLPQIAAGATFTPTVVIRYRRIDTVCAAALTRLWYSV